MTVFVLWKCCCGWFFRAVFFKIPPIKNPKVQNPESQLITPAAGLKINPSRPYSYINVHTRYAKSTYCQELQINCNPMKKIVETTSTKRYLWVIWHYNCWQVLSTVAQMKTHNVITSEIKINLWMFYNRYVFYGTYFMCQRMPSYDYVIPCHYRHVLHLHLSHVDFAHFPTKIPNPNDKFYIFCRLDKEHKSVRYRVQYNTIARERIE